MGESERIAWNDVKNQTNIETRKIDFADLDQAFDGRFRLVVENRRRDDGERRFDRLVPSYGLVPIWLTASFTVIPGRAQREPGTQTFDRAGRARRDELALARLRRLDPGLSLSLALG